MHFLRTSWAGFRLVSSLLKKLLVYGKIGQAPEAETLIQWELKIGLYKLERPKSTTEEWIWMADHVKKELSLGKFTKYAPPKQRSKARYMNLDTLVNWGYNILGQYDELPEKVREKTVWILPLKHEICLWREWLQIGQVTRDVVRTKGFYEGVEELLMDRIIELKLSKASEEFTEALVDYVSAESKGITYDKRVIGSTEVLEGLFGGYKRIAGENKMSVNGLGRLILCMSSRIGPFSEEVVIEAMNRVKCKDVKSWLNQAFSLNRDCSEGSQALLLNKEFLEENQE